MFPGKSVSGVLAWYFERRKAVAAPGALRLQPRECSAPVIVDFTPATLGDLVSVGWCLDRLPPPHRRAVTLAFNLPGEDRRLRMPRQAAAYHAGMTRLGRIMRQRGIIE